MGGFGPTDASACTGAGPGRPWSLVSAPAPLIDVADLAEDEYALALSGRPGVGVCGGFGLLDPLPPAGGVATEEVLWPASGFGFPDPVAGAPAWSVPGPALVTDGAFTGELIVAAGPAAATAAPHDEPAPAAEDPPADTPVEDALTGDPAQGWLLTVGVVEGAVTVVGDPAGGGADVVATVGAPAGAVVVAVGAPPPLAGAVVWLEVDDPPGGVVVWVVVVVVDDAPAGGGAGAGAGAVVVVVVVVEDPSVVLVAVDDGSPAGLVEAADAPDASCVVAVVPSALVPAGACTPPSADAAAHRIVNADKAATAVVTNTRDGRRQSRTCAGRPTRGDDLVKPSCIT